jgi:septal ring factor EnvC (AmiA/AmiB activator)
VAGLSYLSHRRPVGAPEKAGEDPAAAKAEVIAKGLGRSLAEPLANQDDLSLSELLTQTKADHPEVALVTVVNLNGQVLASTDDKAVGGTLSLPQGIKTLGSEPMLAQKELADKSGKQGLWTTVPVLLGKERIGAVYLKSVLAAPAKTPADPLPLPFLLGQAAALLLLLVLLLLGGRSSAPAAEADPAKLAELEQKKREVERELENRRKELKKVESEAGDHNRWLEMFRAEENDLAAQVKKMREERAAHEAEIEQGRKQLIEFEQLLREKQAKLDEISQQLTSRIQEGIELDKRLERVQKQEVELNQRMAELRKGEENLAQWLKSSKVEVQNLVQFIAEKRVEESELEQAIEERRREFQEMEDRIAQQRAEIQELAEICEQWGQERDRVAAEVAEKQQNLTAVMQLLEGTKSRLERLQKQESGVK